MKKSYKYRMYPTEDQQIILNQWFGSVRYIYNLALETKMRAWKDAGKNLSGFDLINQMPDLKDSPEIPWLKDCPADSLNLSILNMDKAYKAFFERRGSGVGYPKFKNKSNKKSISFSKITKIDFENGTITIPKIKDSIPVIFHRTFEGTAKTTTISKTSTNQYYVSILVDDGEELPKKKSIKKKTTVGIDLGVKTFAVLSDGTEYENPKFLEEVSRRLAIAQRTMARRFKKGSKEQSKRYYEAKLEVAKLHQKIANKRKDYQHNISNEIITKYDTIALEDLNVKGMSTSSKGTIETPGKKVAQKSGLNKAILDTGMSSFKSMLQYKAEWSGKNILEINRFEPSSKKCSNCGTVNKSLTLKDREWDCEECGTHHDRDHNAAINIKEIALKNLRASERPPRAKVIH